MHVQEEVDEDEGETGEGQVDPECPAPGEFLGKGAAEDGTDAAGDDPD